MHVMKPAETLAIKLAKMKAEHRDLDAAIEAMQDGVAANQLAIRRLKKRKLALRDEISRIEDELTPDIIA